MAKMDLMDQLIYKLRQLLDYLMDEYEESKVHSICLSPKGAP
ncbi:MAG: hypothetical protein QXE00_00975 [Candidatus Bathyarchaeia archaeon]